MSPPPAKCDNLEGSIVEWRVPTRDVINRRVALRKLNGPSFARSRARLDPARDRVTPSELTRGVPVKHKTTKATGILESTPSTHPSDDNHNFFDHNNASQEESCVR